MRDPLNIDDRTCECRDPECPHCAGRCNDEARLKLYRADMYPEEPVYMCGGCGDEAMEVGLFGYAEYYLDVDEDFPDADESVGA